MEKEFNLSEKIWNSKILKQNLEITQNKFPKTGQFLFKEDVKEAVRLLKEEIIKAKNFDFLEKEDIDVWLLGITDKIFGEELTK